MLQANIIITIVEVILLVITFFLLNLVIGIVFKQISRLSWVRNRNEQIATKIETWRRNISRLLAFTCGVLCLLIIGVNGIVIYQGKSVQEYQLNLIGSIPPQFWFNLFGAIFKSVSLLLLVKYSIPLLHRGLDIACDRAQTFDHITANDESVAAFFKLLKNILTNSIWILTISLCSQFLQLPQIVSYYLFVTLKVYLTVTIGLLIVRSLSAIIDTLDALSVEYSNPENLLRFYERFRHLVPVLKKYLEYVIYVGMATLIVPQIDFIAWMAPYIPKAINIISVFFFTGIFIEIANLILEEIILRTAHLTDLQRQRRLTIIPLIKSIIKYLVYFSAGVSILKTINIDPTPILAGAGIIGLAIGFGAQNLINDVVCGFFILFDNYYLVGDYIEVNTASGFVEAIDLRTTRIRHMNGQLYIVRNGEIKDIINYSKEYIYAVVEIAVAPDSNLDRVYKILEAVGEQFKASYAEVLEPTQVDGLEKIGQEELTVRTITKVKPGTSPHMQRILRKMVKDAFDREGIKNFSPQDISVEIKD